MALALTLGACSGSGPGPSPKEQDPNQAADNLATALTAADLSTVPAVVAGAQPAPTTPSAGATPSGTASPATPPAEVPAAQRDLTTVLSGMDGLKPEVTHGEVKRVGDTADVDLDYTWKLAGGEWKYRSTARFHLDTQSQNSQSPNPQSQNSGKWVLDWQPSVLHPDLTFAGRLVHKNRLGERSPITGQDGALLAADQQVARIGIDKSAVDPATAEKSAAALAKLVDVQADPYVKRVHDAPPQGFVEAIALRTSNNGTSNGSGGTAEIPDVKAIPGARAIPTTRSVSVDKVLAPELLGQVGEASPELIRDSGGQVFPGDPAGTSGLQERYDAQLRGRAGSTITLVARPGQKLEAPADPGGTASPGSTATPDSDKPRVLFDSDPTPGTPLAISLDPALQKKVEGIVNPAKSGTSVVAIRPSTGKIVAAANSDSVGGAANATFGRYAPGSTFKVVTALALLRSGMTPDSTVNCTDTVTVDGRTFKNYNDFPASQVGKMPLSKAIALSCNTAIISEAGKITPQALSQAAASLGLGQDYDAGFPSFFGSLPNPSNEVGKAESLIGQGTIEASVMSMAGVAASVAAGHTVVPALIDGKNPPAPTTGLSADEARQLQSLMRGVVDGGSASSLRGVADGAKTGTAEYGQPGPGGSLPTHAWMIAWRGDLAVAVMVTDGDSGSKSAGPIVAKVLD